MRYCGGLWIGHGEDVIGRSDPIIRVAHASSVNTSMTLTPIMRVRHDFPNLTQIGGRIGRRERWIYQYQKPILSRPFHKSIGNPGDALSSSFCQRLVT
jgi:hypothetical protein